MLNFLDENHELQEERDKALQKIGNLSLGTEDMETRCKNVENIFVNFPMNEIVFYQNDLLF